MATQIIIRNGVLSFTIGALALLMIANKMQQYRRASTSADIRCCLQRIEIEQEHQAEQIA